jgi:hypothetical protein
LLAMRDKRIYALEQRMAYVVGVLRQPSRAGI